MNKFQWYNDQAAKIAYDRVKAAIETPVAELFPGYELSHLGINRNNDTEEVIIKLHLNQIGQVKVVNSESWTEDLKRIK